MSPARRRSEGFAVDHPRTAGRGGEAARELAAALASERASLRPAERVDRSSLPLGFFDACLSRIADDATLFVDRVARLASKDAAGRRRISARVCASSPDSLEAARAWRRCWARAAWEPCR